MLPLAIPATIQALVFCIAVAIGLRCNPLLLRAASVPCSHHRRQHPAGTRRRPDADSELGLHRYTGDQHRAQRNRACQQLKVIAPVGSAVELRIRTTDRDGRSVVELSPSGMNLNQDLVVSGVVIAYRQYISDDDRQIYGHL